MQADAPSPLDRIPPAGEIHSYMGRLYQELALLRRLLRLAQSAQQRQQRAEPAHERREVSRAG